VPTSTGMRGRRRTICGLAGMLMWVLFHFPDRDGGGLDRDRKTMTYRHLTAGDCGRENSDAAWLCFKEIATGPVSPTNKSGESSNSSRKGSGIGELALWYVARKHRKEMN